MKSLLEVLKLSTSYLEQRGIKNARRQAEEIISDALGLQRLELYLQFERPMVESELELCRERLARRAKGEPIQYIRGEVEFLDCSFRVTPSALIPRQETEILVDKIIHDLSKCDLNEKSLWDICCGTGCIGIALKKRFPNLTVVLSDISPEALQLAQENAKRNNVDVAFLKGDLLVPFAGKMTDYIVCNPPYVAENEYAGLDIEVRGHEPRLALIGGPTGLEFYERLAAELPRHMKPAGKVWFELGKGQGSAIQNIFNKLPAKVSRIEQDWAGHDRFFFLEIE